MKVFVIVAFATAIGLNCAKPNPDEGQYTTKYDNVDIDEILKSDRLLGNYFNCLMDKGNCTPEGQELKDIIPDALHTGCSKCSRKHKDGGKKILTFLIDNKPDLWKQLEDKYDKEGTYRKKYKAELEEEGAPKCSGNTLLALGVELTCLYLRWSSKSKLLPKLKRNNLC